MTDKELHKLRRQDLLQLLLMQSKEVSRLQSALEKQESVLAELRETGARLKDQLDEKTGLAGQLNELLEEKDAHILRLNLRLEAKDAHIGKLNQRLEEIEELVRRLDRRQEEAEKIIRSLDARRELPEGETRALPAALEEPGQTPPGAFGLPRELLDRLDRFCAAAEGLLAGEEKRNAAPPEEDGRPSLPEEAHAAPPAFGGEPGEPEYPTVVELPPRSLLKKESIAALLRPAHASRRQGQNG